MKMETRSANVLGSADLVYTCAVAFNIEMNVGTEEEPNWQSYAKVVYGSMWGYFQEATSIEPMLPSGLGGSYMYGENVRGLGHAGYKINFPNLESQMLIANLVRIRIYFEEGDGPWLGEHGSATFVCIQEAIT